MKPNLKVVNTPKNFQQDSELALLETQAELLKLMIKVTEFVEEISRNKIHGVERLNVRKELDTHQKLVELTSWQLEDKLDIYKYHFGETQRYLEVSEQHAEFLEENEALVAEFLEWAEKGGDDL